MLSALGRIRGWVDSGERAASAAVREPDPPHLAAPLAAVAIGLGHALQLANGTLHPIGIAVLVASSCVLAVGLAARHAGPLDRYGETAALVVAAGGLVYQVAALLTTSPGVYLRASQEDYVSYRYLVAAAAVVVGVGLAADGMARKLAVPALLATHFALGMWVLDASPNPPIDVFVWHREAFHALVAGANPYAIQIPNLYGHTEFYGPGLADAATVKVGFPYPPLSLALAAPGHLVGDYRWANLAALTAAGGLMAFMRRGRLSFAAAAIFLLTPRQFFVLEQGWTEALVCFCLALVVFVACRAPRGLSVALGLLLAVKQYAILLMPLALLLRRRPFSFEGLARFFVPAAALAAASVLPFLLWDPDAFFRSVVQFQALQPFRPDALSLMAYFAVDGKPVLPAWLSFAVMPLAWGLALWRAPRTPAGFAASVALLLLLFFGFAKQAFCNYYLLVVSAACCALAAVERTRMADSGGLSSSARGPTSP